MEKAVPWLKKAAEQDYDPAIFKLGLCYKYSEGVEENPQIAFNYFKQSAELGNPYAQSYIRHHCSPLKNQ